MLHLGVIFVIQKVHLLRSAATMAYVGYTWSLQVELPYLLVGAAGSERTLPFFKDTRQRAAATTPTPQRTPALLSIQSPSDFGTRP